jgi:hypothetical protein
MTCRRVRAVYNEHTITVYQAYTSQIADSALSAGTFIAPFKRGRMTWIKPSFLWMMYRSGWGTKPGQERILAIQVTRDGFEWALAHSVLSHYEPGIYADEQRWAERKNTTPVRVQWDPDRTVSLAPSKHRAMQVGLSGEAVNRYLDHWIVSITDITPLAGHIHLHVRSGDLNAVQAELPAEREYPVPSLIRNIIGATDPEAKPLSLF